MEDTDGCFYLAGRGLVSLHFMRLPQQSSGVFPFTFLCLHKSYCVISDGALLPHVSLSLLMNVIVFEGNSELLICCVFYGKQTADEGCLIVLIGSSRPCSVWLVVGWGWAK